MMQLAMYKGPATGWINQVGHWLTCVFTVSRYSHCELVIGGLCHSSSVRDGGVRSKAIDLDSGHWDVFPIQGDEPRALAWFHAHQGEAYDWRGIFAFLAPDLRLVRRTIEGRKQWFCSEACAAALGLPAPETLDPQELLERLVDELPT